MSKNQPNFLTTRKKMVDKYFLSWTNGQKKLWAEHPQAEATFHYLESFARSGKTIRGALFLEVLRILKVSENELDSFLPSAAALELIHSALLIQDDFMDGDEQRRGLTALHVLLEKEAKAQKLTDPKLQATSGMICSTDICFFLAFGELGKFPHPQLPEVLQYLASEYVHVGFAQWQDVSLGIRKTDYDLDEVKAIYKYKTARYTFVLPLKLACLYAKLEGEKIAVLEKLGELMGMVFQITDDYLNIFGDPQITGKPTGSDLAENKKTFYHYYLNQTTSPLRNLFGKKNITPGEIEQFGQELSNLGINAKIEQIIADYETQFGAQLEKLADEVELKTLLQELFAFIKNRQK